MTTRPPAPNGTTAVHGDLSKEAFSLGETPKPPAGATRRRGPVALPVVQTSTFAFADTADLVRYFDGGDPDPDRQEYGRYGNPTVIEVERRIAALDAGEDALLFASGMAAVTTAILALVKAGDHVIVTKDGYRRTRQFVSGTLARFGVTHTLIESASLDALAEAIGPKTRVALTELPTNPYLRCVDVARFAAICRERRVKSIVDATLASPINATPLARGADLVAHSATKYLAGHNDVLAGSISGSAALVSLVRELRSVLGGVLDPHAAALVGRGIKTLALRVARHNETGLAAARLLSEHPSVERVHYPMLPSHPDHAVAARELRGGGGVVSFVVKGGRAVASRVVDGFRLATIAPSLGGVESLVEQPAVMSYHELGDEELAALGVEPGLVRLSVGVEETDDVLADLSRALDASGVSGS